MKQMLTCTLLSVYYITHVQGLCDEIDLQKVLLSRYNRNVIPRSNDSYPVTVNATLYLMNIIRLNEPEELLQANSWLAVRWHDVNLVWRPEDYMSNISSTILKQGDIWTPDLTVLNSTRNLRHIGYADLNVKVKANGKVSWDAGLATETICEMDVEYFPFDEQQCTIEISTWIHSPSMVKFALTHLSINKSSFERNGQWAFALSTAHIIECDSFTTLVFGINLTRRTGFYITSLVIPVVVISILSTFVFFIPITSGERMTYSVTTFLSYIVLLSLTTSSLPKTSLQIPIFVTYICSMFGLGFMSVLCSAISVNIPKLETEHDKTHRNDVGVNSMNAKTHKTKQSAEADANSNEIELDGIVNVLTLQSIHDVKTRTPQIQVNPQKVNTAGPACRRKAVITAALKYFDIYMFVFIAAATITITMITFWKLMYQN